MAESAACTGVTPFCGANNTCQACTMHSHCTSNVCVPDGTCSDGKDVAYVDPQNGRGDTCSKDVPCASLSTALARNLSYIKMTGVLEENVTLQGSVTILADPGAQLKAKVPGPVVRVGNSSRVSIYDLEITGVSDDGTVNVTQSIFSNNEIGFQGGYGSVTLSESTFSDNLKDGLWASGPGTVRATQSTFRNNQYGVRSGGDQVVGTLHVTRSLITNNSAVGIAMLQPTTRVLIANNFIVRNGGATPGSGGIWGFPSVGSEIKFNTIVDNVADASAGSGGIECKSPIDVTNNLIYRNTGGPSNPQLTPDCRNVGSYIGSSSGNAPGFAQPNIEPYDYHLTANTPNTIRDKTDCGGTDNDFDGDPRPLDATCDVGADEYKAP